MESGLAVGQPDATNLTVVKGAAGGKLAETTARCLAAIAAEASLRHAQAGLAVAQERLQRARDAEMRLRARRASRMPAA